MNLLINILNGVRHENWTMKQAFTHLLKAIKREVKTIPNFKKKYIVNSAEKSYIDIKGAKFPYEIITDRNLLVGFLNIFEDVFTIPVYYNNDYNKQIVQKVDAITGEGPYGYIDGDFDVTVKKEDIVIDAGAWIGDFSAYSASLGAICYAFEPVNENFKLLSKTALLNDNLIIPVQKGLSNTEGEIYISAKGSSSSIISSVKETTDEKIKITTLDNFIVQNSLQRVDFIKADIEGAERLMLKGATNILKKFAPKLAICTYHLPDDPEVLDQIIKDANPAYEIRHLRHKLMACVPNKNDRNE